MDRTDIDVQEGILMTGMKDSYACSEQVEFEILIPEDLRDGSHNLGIAKTSGP